MLTLKFSTLYHKSTNYKRILPEIPGIHNSCTICIRMALATNPRIKPWSKQQRNCVGKKQSWRWKHFSFGHPIVLIWSEMQGQQMPRQQKNQKLTLPFLYYSICVLFVLIELEYFRIENYWLILSWNTNWILYHKKYFMFE